MTDKFVNGKNKLWKDKLNNFGLAIQEIKNDPRFKQWNEIRRSMDSVVAPFMANVTEALIDKLMQDSDPKTCKTCQNLKYTNPYADSYECVDCGMIFVVSHKNGRLKLIKKGV